MCGYRWGRKETAFAEVQASVGACALECPQEEGSMRERGLFLKFFP